MPEQQPQAPVSDPTPTTPGAAFPPALPMRRPHRRRWAHGRTIVALMLREMSSQYGKSPGGYVWAIFEPLGMIIILSFGFSLMLRSPSLGNSFLLFYATGFLPYNLFNKISRLTMTSITYSRALLKYPAVTWFDAVMARAVLNTLTSALISYLLLAGILIVVDSRTVLDYPPILDSFAMAACLGLGFGLVNCVITGFFPVWQQIWNIFTRPLFIASGVIWIYPTLPSTAQNILWYNPLVHVTGLVRTGFYPTFEPQYISGSYVYGLSLVLIALGLLLMRRFHLQILGRS